MLSEVFDVFRRVGVGKLDEHGKKISNIMDKNI